MPAAPCLVNGLQPAPLGTWRRGGACSPCLLGMLRQPPWVAHFQAMPFQRRIRVLGWAVPWKPTAQASLAEVVATPARKLPAGLGPGTRFHAVPFQCEITFEPMPQALRAETAATPGRP